MIMTYWIIFFKIRCDTYNEKEISLTFWYLPTYAYFSKVSVKMTNVLITFRIMTKLDRNRHLLSRRREDAAASLQRKSSLLSWRSFLFVENYGKQKYIQIWKKMTQRATKERSTFGRRPSKFWESIVMMTQIPTETYLSAKLRCRGRKETQVKRETCHSGMVINSRQAEDNLVEKKSVL